MLIQNNHLHNSSYKNRFILLVVLFHMFNLFSQKRVDNNSSKQVYEEKNVDNKPEFQGGSAGIKTFIASNYKMPDIDSYNGKVIINFVVEIDGTLSDFNVLKDIGYGTAEEATRVFQKSPKWSPGILDGKPVRVLVSFPITLKSDED